jgi:RND family efflux transporter MFP subunit
MNKKSLYTLLVLIVGMGLALLIGTSKPEMATENREPVLRTIRAMEVKAKSEHLAITSQGAVEPRSQSELIPEVYGRVEWISPALVGGGIFNAGDVLLRIESADYESALRRAEAIRDRSEVEAEFTRDELKRLQKLHAQKLASESQLDSAVRAARVAEANLIDSRAALDQAQRDLARTELTAPFDGMVRNEKVDLGQFVSRGTNIGTIYATDYVEVRLPIAADQMRYLGIPLAHRGQIAEGNRPPVTVSANFGDASLIWEGELVRTEAEIDQRSRMIYGVVRIEMIPNEDSPLIPVGLFVQAEIQGRLVENVVRLPRSAMRDNNQVLVIDSENRLRFRTVSVLRLEHDDVLISSGLEDGELVCISAIQTVVDGMHVTPLVD